MLHDLGMKETDYSLGVSIFFVGYILFEVPSNILLKMTSAPTWFCRIMITWGICSICMMFTTNVTSLCVIRFFLGVSEAGFFPGVIYYLSLWFTPDEKASRIGLFYSASAVSGFLGGIFAYGLLQMDGLGGLHGWQWLFLIEGLPTVVLGVITYFTLPRAPAYTNWLTLQEKNHILWRLAQHDQEAESRKVDWDQVKEVFKDWRIWLLAVQYLSLLTPVYSASFFLPAILQGFGYSTLVGNLLTAPIWGVTVVVILVNSYHSDRTGDRQWHVIVPCLLGTIFWILLAVSFDPSLYSRVPPANITSFPLNISIVNGTSTPAPAKKGNIGFQYSMALFSISLCYSAVGILLAQITEFLKGGSAVAVSTAFVIGVGNVGGIIGPQIFGATVSQTGSYALACGIMSVFMFMTSITGMLQIFLLKKFPKETAPEGSFQDNFVPLEVDPTEEEEKSRTNNTFSSQSKGEVF